MRGGDIEITVAQEAGTAVSVSKVTSFLRKRNCRRFYCGPEGMPNDGVVLSERQAHVRWITINRPRPQWFDREPILT